MATRTVSFEFKRQASPEAAAVWEKFELEWRPGVNVVSAMMEIARNPVTADGRPTTPIAYDSNCLEEICGSCAMRINGRARMACSALVDNLEQPIKVEPLTKFPLVRDLQVDRSVLFENLMRVKAWVPVDGTYDLGSGPRVYPQEQEANYPLSNCISCCCCMEVCPQFNDATGFVGAATIAYLLTESRSAASPLIAALTDAVMGAGGRGAERSGGRLAPPMVVVLDEAANICRIADLPELYSHLGSRGMVPVTILQSYQQGVSVWGEPGMAALWGAATKKVIGAGIDDPRLARDLATLVGQHDVPVISVSYGDGRASQQVSLRRQEILDAADIRALAPGSALLLATGVRPALVSLRPWYSGPQAAQITAAIAQAEAAMQRAAQSDHAEARPAAMPFQHGEEIPS